MWVRLKFLEEFEDGSVRIGKSRTKVDYKKGQKVVLLKDLAHYLGITYKPLRAFLDALVDERLIEIEYNPKYTIITFIDCNQLSNQNSRKSKRNQQLPKSNPQSLFIEEEIEEVEEKEITKNPISLSRDEEIKILTEIGKEEYLQQRVEMLNLSLEIVKMRYATFFRRFKEGNKTHKDEADLRSHFDNILAQSAERAGAKKINLTNGTGQSQPQSGSQQAQAQDKYSSRRGTDAGSHTPDDYAGTF